MVSFSKFKSWYLENSYESEFHLELDKDLKFIGNKVYSENTCLLLEPNINTFVSGLYKPESVFPIGVACYKDRNKKYKCQINLGKGQEKHGAYYSALEAHQVWQKLKAERALYLSNTQKNVKVKTALINFANLILEDIRMGKETIFN